MRPSSGLTSPAIVSTHKSSQQTNTDTNLTPFLVHHHMALQPKSGPGLPFGGFVTITLFTGWNVSPAPNLEDQASVFTTPGHRVTQLYPQALGNHFSRLLRHAWVTVGLFRSRVAQAV
jgi:hypothetical protein